MNPVIIKPTDDHRSQAVVLGTAIGTFTVPELCAHSDSLWHVVTSSLDTLREQADVVVIEGVGSPAEINLRHFDLVNMRVARYAEAPVVLVSDIERGGVFASLFGTAMLLPTEDRLRIVGFLINKFRGDASMLLPGFEMLRERTGIPTLGVLPWREVHLPEEDSVGLSDSARAAHALLDIAVVRLPHVSNFDDFDALAREPGVNVRYVTAPEELEGADLVILPGTKSTLQDLAWLRSRSLDRAIIAHRRDGRPLLGVCGGFQMLGRSLRDPAGVESSHLEALGLGLLDVDTTFERVKVTRVANGVTGDGSWLGIAAGLPLRGYEVHVGSTRASGSCATRIQRLGDEDYHDDGAVDHARLTMGTYLHGLFTEPGFRRAMLERLAATKGIRLPASRATQDDACDEVAALLRAHVNMDALRRAMRIS